MVKEQAKIFKNWSKIPTVPPCSIVVVMGKKMSNPNYEAYMTDSEGDKCPVVQQGNSPYIIDENNVYSISELANLFETALNKINDGATISIVIGIDN